MKVNIIELLSYRDLSVIGLGADILSKNRRFINKRQRGIFGLYFADAPGIAVDEFITPELYEEATAFTGDETTEDFIFLTEILLNVFQYQKKKLVINQRLKLFCLKQIIFLQHNSNAEQPATLFRFLPFFHPCPEDFLDKFSLNRDCFLYKGTPVDLPALIGTLFDKFIHHKSQFPSLADFSKEHLSISKALVLDMLEVMLSHVRVVSYEVPGKGHPDLLTSVFSQPRAFFDLYNNKREEFFRLLEASLPLYVVKSWDNDPDAQASVYYGATRNDTIEAYFNRPSRFLRRKKYLVEFFVDMYVFYILCHPEGVRSMLDVYETGSVSRQQILTILFSHPFYNADAKVRLIESGVYKLLPEGFWKDRVNKMAASM